jgi:uncharacterized protein
MNSLKHPGRWLWLILLVPVVLGLLRLRFDAEVFDLLPERLPAVQGLKLFQAHFANARELIVTVTAPEAAQAENTARKLAEHLRTQTNLVASVTWEPPWLEHPEQAAELLAFLWFNQPPDAFSELAQRLAPDKLVAVLVAAREQLANTLSPEQIARISYDPFGLTRLPESVSGTTPSFSQGDEAFSSPDGTLRVLFIQANRDLATYRDCEQWLEALKREVEAGVRLSSGAGPDNSATNRGPEPALSAGSLAGLKLGYTGRPAFVAEVAGSMQHDMTISVGGTAAIIAVLFWLAHRRVKPMLWLLTLLALILGATLALGGLIFGTVNVVSMGFAAILLGLAVDYAVVHYQEALAHPELSIPQIRHAIAPSIFWAAVTTITAFLVLNFGGLPGLGQLGTLVGLGVALSACIMIFEYLPPLFPERRTAGATGTCVPQHSQPAPGAQDSSLRHRRSAAVVITLLLVVVTGCVLFSGLPRIDPTADALRPRNSQAYATLAALQKNLTQSREPLWLIVSGQTESEVARRLDEVQSILESGVSNHLIAEFKLPTPLWPRPEFQRANRSTAFQLVAEREAFRKAALTNGFAEASLGLTERMLDHWALAAGNTATEDREARHQSGGAGPVPSTSSPREAARVYWPTNAMSQWLFQKVAARTATNFFALGLVNPLETPNSIPGKAERMAALQRELPHSGVWLSGWELLGSSIFSEVKANQWKVMAPMSALVLLSLLLAFRRPTEILLSLAVMLLSGLCLLTTMRLANWSWNLLNLMAVPLILGTGVDYSIFMQLALRRYQGDLAIAHRAVGRALLLCGATAIAGFGSLAWSSNAGMASLGQECAVGIGSNMLIAVFLLPLWWQAVRARTKLLAADPAASTLTRPSALYRPELWRLASWLVRRFPAGFCLQLSGSLARIYALCARRRREVVIRNLLPALAGDRVAAEKKTGELFQQFAIKLVDLWRYESGLPIDNLLGESTGWEHLVRAREQNRGVLLLTPHLGNWEFGAPWLTRHGIELQVVTLAEPGAGFTQLRQAARARWNIQTVVIGEDPFAFVEIIRRLEAGAIIALLVDRPPPPTAVEVQLFGQPFFASVAAAELARASGCVLLPVYLSRSQNKYAAHVLPPIPYDRAALRDRVARQKLTQETITVFEPIIRQHLDQWFHFVPVWPSEREAPEVRDF